MNKLKTVARQIRQSGAKLRRAAKWLVLVLAVVAVAEVSGILTLAGSVVSPPVKTPVPAANMGYGVAVAMADKSQEELTVQLNDLQALGVGRLRMDIGWNRVQAAGPTAFDWKAYDRVVQAAQARGFKMLLIIDFTPTWARASACASSQWCGPADPEQYGKFAAAVAQHYKAYGVTDFEIWNEPNISYRFRPAASPALYTAMLKSAYTRIKEIYPSATVLAASTAPSASTGDSFTPSDFLSAMYTSGARGYFDVISAHPYTYPITPFQSSPGDAWGQLPGMHAQMAAQGDGDKKIWLTEFGAPTDGPNVARDHVTEAVQAQILQEGLAVLATKPWAGPVFWYEYKDTAPSSNPATSESFYGLIRFDGSHKPVYAVLSEATHKR